MTGQQEAQSIGHLLQLHPYFTIYGIAALIAIGGAWWQLKKIYKAIFDDSGQLRFLPREEIKALTETSREETKTLHKETRQHIESEMNAVKDRMVGVVKDIFIVSGGPEDGDVRYAPKRWAVTAMNNLEERLKDRIDAAIDKIADKVAEATAAQGKLCPEHHKNFERLSARVEHVEGEIKAIKKQIQK